MPSSMKSIAWAFSAPPATFGASKSTFSAGVSRAYPGTFSHLSVQRPRPPKWSATISTDPLAGTASKPTDSSSIAAIAAGLQSVPEVRDPIQLEVIGKLPPYLGTGKYYRNGPGLFEAPHADGEHFVAEHWFDGIGTVHAFSFNAKKGTVTYMSKMTGDSVMRSIASMRKDAYNTILVANKDRSALGIARNLFRPIALDPETGEVPCNVSVTLENIPSQGPLGARGDINCIHQLDPLTLETVEKYTFSKFSPDLKHTLCPSHGQLDTQTGQYFNCTFELGPTRVEYKVFRIGATGETEVLATFREKPCYIHSFSLTQNYVVIILCPLMTNLFKLLATKSFLASCEFKADKPSTFLVISRETGGVVARYEHESFCYFHTLNAFEMNDDIIVDLAYFKDAQVLEDLRVDNMKAGGQIATSKPMRFTLADVPEAMRAGAHTPSRASSSLIADVVFDLGTLSPERKLLPYRYVYGISDIGRGVFCGDVVKLDTQRGTVLRWSQPGTVVGEPMFVPNPQGTTEDDGTLIVIGIDSNTETSFLLVLDAKSMTEVARAILPLIVPLGFHGTFAH